MLVTKGCRTKALIQVTKPLVAAEASPATVFSIILTNPPWATNHGAYHSSSTCLYKPPGRKSVTVWLILGQTE